MKYRVITVAREFGSGGREIGKKVAEQLGLKYYDREIVLKAAEESGLSTEYIEQNGEYAASKNIFAYAFIGRDLNGHSVTDELGRLQRDIIQKAAEDAPCVIIGRGADYILRDRSDVLSVFIHAETDAKQKRIMKLYRKTEKEALDMMRDIDKKRAINHKYFTDREWGKSKYYTMCLNSSQLGIDECVSLICKVYLRGAR